MRWQYRDAGLLWLFVPAYVIHLAEEWFADFPGWLQRITARPLPDEAFLIINAVALALLIGAIHLATRSERFGWMAVAVATIMLVNTVAHAAGAALTRSYAPGLISAVVLYVPLGSLTMIRALDHAGRKHVARGIITGVVVHAVVSALAFASTR